VEQKEYLLLVGVGFRDNIIILKYMKKIKDIKRKQKQSLTMKGVYYITKANIETKEQKLLCEKIDELRNQGKEFMSLVRKLNSICKVERMVFENIIPDVARIMIANNLIASSPTNDMIVEYIAVGTDNTAVDNADTTLGNEADGYRNSVASKTNGDPETNVAYVSGFFNATECDGTYYEAGIFCDATSTTDSGILLSHVLIDAPTGVVKANTNTLTIDWELQIN